MTLGILVNTDNYGDDIKGIAQAAVKKGHKVIIFFMDKGCRLATAGGIVSLCSSDNISMGMCDYNRNKMGISKEELPAGIVCGSQYDNAVMNRDADKVMVF
ncbi:MAG: hypothetical protein A2077_02755 [Nitrospirae bacterium GWC2_46_6]|nr:MAG: hypothetical protein A2077_02755 [Nitrospirae bacterium GWC2_46_6]OGW23513.1 MAG: hypothetical protein A2X55_03985 [Nitrospirae bacterium GWB2_47_37]HAK87484.1 hypothetical protein [Nitrospiraceae bacterium]HCL80866.1 hypothetical protein [Nitrospiraceae bacterium]